MRTLSLLWLLCGLALTGCSGSPDFRPDIGLHLVAKAQVFLDTSAILFSQEPRLWGSGLRSLYYCALTLARIKDVRAFHRPTEKFHEKVWNMSSLAIRRYFRNDLRQLRLKHDYLPEPLSQTINASETATFFRSGTVPFQMLIDETREHLIRDFHQCSGVPTGCRHCVFCRSPACLRASALEQLSRLDDGFHKLCKTHGGDKPA